MLGTPSLKDDRKIKCNCHNNHCAQGYCDCLKNGIACDPLKCGCTECVNTVDNSDLRLSLKSKQTSRVAMLSAAEIKDTPILPFTCKCSKSKCQKKYCECYQAGRTCGLHCKCSDCHNGHPGAHDFQMSPAEEISKSS